MIKVSRKLYCIKLKIKVVLINTKFFGASLTEKKLARGIVKKKEKQKKFPE